MEKVRKNGRLLGGYARLKFEIEMMSFTTAPWMELVLA